MEKPNILLIVLDTQRADSLSCYAPPPSPDSPSPNSSDGLRPPTTPHLDQLASEATLFERAIAPAQWTIPSHASMFTGEYPSTHEIVQADRELSLEHPTLAEILKLNGYSTTGFCNNPLVGILKNGLRRGFEAFYNYGGILPTRPADGTPLPRPLAWLLEQYTQFWRRLSYPFQNAFARSDTLFQLALHPWIVPIWTQLLSFKGNTAQSLRDVSRFLEQQARDQNPSKPFFCFVNLMETHLPYWPPDPFIQKFAPYFSQNRAARDFLRQYNYQPYRWMAPLQESLDPLQSQVLRDIYDAETSYQDHLLGQVFQTLKRSGLEDNTMVVVVADHGEGLGEHDFVGHAFVVFEELVRVPLLVRYPKLFPAGKRIFTPVSTRRLFHTVLEAAGVGPQSGSQSAKEIRRFSLSRTVAGQDPEQSTVLTEAFPPHILIRAMEKRSDQLLQERACHSARRAVYQGNQKLVQVGDHPSLYDLSEDPAEAQDQSTQDPDQTRYLEEVMQKLVWLAESRRPQQSTQGRVDLDSDGDLVRRMQELGYLE